ncbi:MAG TPA: hypothetical protein VKU60_05060 [Chloroflexota bacterium]|nr:hypothetical protein [Chloroflexota bacterium]
MFVAARGHPQFEISQRTWLEADRSYFLRWREKRPNSPLKVIALLHVYQLPEMACRLSLIPFQDASSPPVHQYAALLREQLVAEGFA